MPTITNNFNIKAVYSQINIFIVEMQASASAGTQTLLDDDKARINSWIDALQEYSDKVLKGTKMLDLPNVHPRGKSLPDAPVKKEVVNKFITELVDMLAEIRDQMLESSSSNISNGLISFDQVRYDNGLGKLTEYMSGYVEEVEPLDEPETTKRATGS